MAKHIPDDSLAITVILAVRNEAANLPRCIASLKPASRVVAVDSHSTDGTQSIAQAQGAEVLQFDYSGGYPKKRQWAIEAAGVATEWLMMVDADEVVPAALWYEIAAAIGENHPADAYVVTKGFHFLGRRFRFGGFSFGAVILWKSGKGRFEKAMDDPDNAQDMEVHERVVVEGRVVRLKTPLVHEDLKDLSAYIDRHNKYATWDARMRHQFLKSGFWGEGVIRPRLFGDAQERRRYLKGLAARVPFEPQLWFLYHYVLRLGLLEGRRGLIASQIRAFYIALVRAKVYELRLLEKRQREGSDT